MTTAIAILVKQTRQYKGLTQQELATKLGWTSTQTISNIERGISSLPLSRLKRFQKVTGVDKRRLAEAFADDRRQKVLQALR